MSDDEKFVMDAEIVSVISSKAFRARLGNGHEFVAFRGREEESAAPPKVAEIVSVEMSPFDLSKGRILGPGKARLS